MRSLILVLEFFLVIALKVLEFHFAVSARSLLNIVVLIFLLICYVLLLGHQHSHVSRMLHQVEYSKRYEQSSPSSQSCIHLLSEGHLLLRTALLQQDCESAERAQLQEAFQESCAHLGDCFSRSAAAHGHLIWHQ